MRHLLLFIQILAISCCFIFGQNIEGLKQKEADAGNETLIKKSLNIKVREFLEDGKYLFTFPQRANKKGVATTSLFLLSTSSLIILDEDIRGAIRRNRSSGSDTVADFFEPLGRFEINLVECGLLYLGARVFDNEYMRESSLLAFESLIYTALITSTSKAIFGREGPSSQKRWRSFFNGSTLFPSGHTSRSFAIATVFAERYKDHNKFNPYISYSIASLIGLSMMINDSHWTSDVFAGVAMGIVIGKSIVKRYDMRKSLSQFSVIPVLDLSREEVGFSLTFRFQ